MNKSTYLFFKNKIIGPYEHWEIKLLASKYRDFHVYLGGEVWVAYNRWDKNMPSISSLKISPAPPATMKVNALMFRRFIKRNLFKDHH